MNIGEFKLGVLIVISCSLGFGQGDLKNARDLDMKQSNLSALAARMAVETRTRFVPAGARLVNIQSEEWESPGGGYDPFSSEEFRPTSGACRIFSWLLAYRLPQQDNEYVTVRAKVLKQGASGQQYKIRTEIADSGYIAEFAKGCPPLPNRTIDNPQAEQIARASGGQPGSGPPFHLHMALVDGQFAPVWLLPYSYPDFLNRAIRADTGQFVYLITGSMSDRSWIKNPQWTAKKP